MEILTAKECKFEVIKLIAQGFNRQAVCNTVIPMLVLGGFSDYQADLMINDTINLVTKDIIYQ